MNNEKHFDHYIQLNKFYDLHSNDVKKLNNEKEKKQIKEPTENTMFYGPS